VSASEFASAGTVKDIYGGRDEFLSIFSAARLRVRKDRESYFLDDMQKRFDVYGEGMVLSVLQQTTLARLARREARKKRPT
jgi:hypothetical protein